MKAGIVLSSVPFLLMGLLLMGTGMVFLVAPELLRDQGFRQDASFGVRAAGFLFFGVTGGLFARSGWRLIRRRRRGLGIAQALGLGMVGFFANRILGSGDPSLLNVVGLAASGFTVGYLSVPAVRSLFRGRRGDAKSLRDDASRNLLR